MRLPGCSSQLGKNAPSESGLHMAEAIALNVGAQVTARQKSAEASEVATADHRTVGAGKQRSTELLQDILPRARRQNGPTVNARQVKAHCAHGRVARLLVANTCAR